MDEIFSNERIKKKYSLLWCLLLQLRPAYTLKYTYLRFGQNIPDYT